MTALEFREALKELFGPKRGWTVRAAERLRISEATLNRALRDGPQGIQAVAVEEMLARKRMEDGQREANRLAAERYRRKMKEAEGG